MLLRNSVKVLMPELKRLRLDGYTFEQLSKLLTSINIPIKSYELRDIFNELMADGMVECIRRMDEQILLLEDLEKITGKHQPVLPVGPCDNEPSTAQVGREMRCDPFPPSIKALARRAEVDAAVYDSDDLMEHPAILGLMLTKAERILWGSLEYRDGGGAVRIETTTERRFRIKWQKPIPMTPTSTSESFVKMDMELFKKKQQP